MSSVGQAVGGIVGAVVGFYVGGPSGAYYGAQIGMMAGGLIDPPKVQGPRLDDLSAQTSTYGVFIPRIYGTAPVVGNIFWIQGNKLIEREAEDSGKGGPEVTNFEYFATFAVGLCEGPIAGVRRIWIGGQLWYDAGSSDIGTIIASNEVAAGFTLYTGTDTQLADPLIQADHGVANVPAYRGLAYIVFNELPVKDYGNSLAGAQVKVEVMSVGTKSAWSTISNLSFSYSTGGEREAITYADRESFYDWTVDVVGITPVPSRFTEWRIDNLLGTRSIKSQVSIDLDKLYEYNDASACRLTSIGYGDQHALVVPVAGPYGLAVIYDSGNVVYAFPAIGSWECISRYALVNGILAYCSTNGGGGGTDKHLIIHDLTSGASEQYEFPGGIPQIITSMASSSGKIFIIGSGIIYVFDLATRAFVISQSLTSFTGIAVINGGDFEWSGNPATQYLFFVDNQIIYRVNTITYVVEPIITSTEAFLTGGRLRLFYDIGEDLIFCRKIPLDETTYASHHLAYAQNIINSSLIQLSEIVTSECLKSDLLTAADLDVTDLTAPVRGYRVSSLAPLRGGIDPLRKAWPFDVIQHGYKIKFKRRGGASVATVTDGELDARAAGDTPGVQITNVREMDLVLPKQLTAKYLDAAREYDVNVAEESRQ